MQKGKGFRRLMSSYGYGWTTKLTQIYRKKLFFMENFLNSNQCKKISLTNGLEKFFEEKKDENFLQIEIIGDSFVR